MIQSSVKPPSFSLFWVTNSSSSGVWELREENHHLSITNSMPGTALQGLYISFITVILTVIINCYYLGSHGEEPRKNLLVESTLKASTHTFLLWLYKLLLVSIGVSSVLCDDLAGWNGGGEGIHEGGDICIHIADSLCCAGENNATL